MQRENYKFDPDDEALSFCLDLWCRLHSRNDLKLSWRGRSVALQSNSGLDSEQLYDKADMKEAEAVDASIASLPRHLEWAIGKMCGMNTVWRYPNINYAEALIEAKSLLIIKLSKNPETRRHFQKTRLACKK